MGRSPCEGIGNAKSSVWGLSFSLSFYTLYLGYSIYFRTVFFMNSIPPLQPTAIGFSLANAHALIQAAGLAYHPPNEVTAQALAWGFRHCELLDSGPTQGYVMANERAIVVSFRGTQGKDLRDWITNLDFDRIETPNGMVHCGFNKAVDRVFEDLLLAVIKFRTQGQALFLTGHSLGGALATLATLRLVNAGQSVAGLYTFGSPRVGDRTYFDRFNTALNMGLDTAPISRAFRIVNDKDIVPKLPFKATGYCHVGEKYRFDTQGYLCLNPVPLQGLMAAIQDEIEDLLEPDWEVINDHYLGSYKTVILANLLQSIALVPELVPELVPALV